MDEGGAVLISPREMIGLAELCDRAGDRSFAILMVECALLMLSRSEAAGAATPRSDSAIRQANGSHGSIHGE